MRIWDVATRREIKSLPGHTAVILSLSFSPDGKTLASAGSDGKVFLWDLVTEREPTRLRGARAAVVALSFPPRR